MDESINLNYTIKIDEKEVGRVTLDFNNALYTYGFTFRPTYNTELTENNLEEVNKQIQDIKEICKKRLKDLNYPLAML